MKTVYLGLGSNLGNRAANLEEAIARLAADGVETVRRSSIYETEPRELRDQPWFLNMVLEAGTGLFPRQLLGRIRQIEQKMGRRREIPKGPRLIDIDILAYGRFTIDLEELTVPHPALRERRFVLEPLAEIAPGWRHPVTRESIADLLTAVRDQEVRKFTGDVRI